MADRDLEHCHILVVEDEYLLADELVMELEDRGATVLGPAPTVSRALALLEMQSSPDGAILDLNLGGEPAFPLADLLIARGVPLIFTTGYDASVIPDGLSHVPRCEKPIQISRVLEALKDLLHPRRGA